jgi:hypothetical protein
MAATVGMIETVPKITPTSVATSLGTPDPTIATSTVTRDRATTGRETISRETISRNKRSALTLDIPKVPNSIRGSSTVAPHAPNAT